jgi:uncharacterized protein YggT (Ycf19 family)
MEEITQSLVYFGLYFLTIFFQLVYYSILAWVILTWVMLFGGMKPQNPMFQFFTRIVEPILKPFAWARLGALDLSPVVAIVALSLIVNVMQNALASLV